MQKRKENKCGEAQMVIQGREMKAADLIARIDRNQQLLERATSPKTSYHLLSLIEKLLTEKESTENELIKARARLEQILREKFDKDKFHNDLQNRGKIFRDASTNQQREIILSVVDKVDFNVDTRDAKIYLKINPAFLHSNSCVLSNNGRCRDYIEHNNSVRVKRAIKVSILRFRMLERH